MTTPIEQFSFLPTTGSGVSTIVGSVKSAFGDWAGDVINVVRHFGADPTGGGDSTTAIQNALAASVGTTGSPHGGSGIYPSYFINRPVYFPPGNYITSATIQLNRVAGLHLFGANRLSTTITNAVANQSCFATNGFSYCRIEGLQIGCTGNGKCFDLDWDGTGAPALQSNTFADCFFAGPGGVNTSIGLRIGASTFMGSETLILNCYFSGLGTGIESNASNSTMNTMVGGNMAANNIGIHVNNGGFEGVHSVSLQQQGTADIQIESNVGTVMAIVGCRSESTNFVVDLGGQAISVIACRHTGVGTNGTFVKKVGGFLTVTSSQTDTGQLQIIHGGTAVPANVSVHDSNFARNDWLSLGVLSGIGNPFPAEILLENLIIGPVLYGGVGQSIRKQRIFTRDDGTTITRNYDIESLGTGAAPGDFTAIYNSGFVNVSVSNGAGVSPAIVTLNNHFLALNAPIAFPQGTMGSPLANNTTYYAQPIGTIGLLGSITGGSGYVNGSYVAVPLTGGTGSGATANITVGGGAVTVVTIANIGTQYTAGDVLSASNANLGGAGSGFSVPVSVVYNSTTFSISATVGGASINTNGVTSGAEISIPYLYSVGDAILKTNTVSGGTPGWICTTAGYLTTGGGAVFKAMAAIAA